MPSDVPDQELIGLMEVVHDSRCERCQEAFEHLLMLHHVDGNDDKHEPIIVCPRCLMEASAQAAAHNTALAITNTMVSSVFDVAGQEAGGKALAMLVLNMVRHQGSGGNEEVKAIGMYL